MVFMKVILIPKFFSGYEYFVIVYILEDTVVSLQFKTIFPIVCQK